MNSIGIDVSKEKSTICILKPYGEVIATPYEIKHADEDLKALVRRIRELIGETKVVLEATGAYHLPIVTALHEAGIFVAVINPLAMKKYASAAIRKGKTDRLDAVRIANYGIDNWFRLSNYTPPKEIYEQLKLLGRQYSHYIKMKIESKLALTNILDRTMPGIKKLLISKRSQEPTKDKLNDFVEKYWHFDNITSKSEKQFTESYCKWAKSKGYRANETKAKEIYALARSGNRPRENESKRTLQTNR